MHDKSFLLTPANRHRAFISRVILRNSILWDYSATKFKRHLQLECLIQIGGPNSSVYPVQVRLFNIFKSYHRAFVNVRTLTK